MLAVVECGIFYLPEPNMDTFKELFYGVTLA
jgi:hypothetical protein